MKEVSGQRFSEERALFGEKDMQVRDCTFEKGESPVKECRGMEFISCEFHYKYPIWYSENIRLEGCTLFDMARAGIWYTKDISVEDTVVIGPKNFRRVKRLDLVNVVFTNAEETLWNCENIWMENVTAKGPYFAMGCKDMEISHLTWDGNYPFDGAKNITVTDSRLLSKDAFWNCENVTVKNSYLSGEYLAWNSKDVTFENCTIESLQGLCYVENLVLKNCKLRNTSLAFEYSSVEADIDGKVSSILNPGSGRISCDSIGELIIEKDRVDPEKTKIFCRTVEKRSDVIEWENFL